jgi:hypothetical protein
MQVIAGVVSRQESGRMLRVARRHVEIDDRVAYAWLVRIHWLNA